MLRKASLAIAGTLMLSGIAAAAPFAVQQGSPVSITDSNPSYSASDAARYPVRGIVGTARAAQGAVNTPASVEDSMPEMVGGRSMPTHQGAHGATFTQREATIGGVRGLVQTPASVEDANLSRIRGR